ELVQQRERFELTLAEREREFERRLETHREHADRRIADMAAGFERAMTAAGAQATTIREDFDRTLDSHRSPIKRDTERLCASADRYVAQAQARASLILDGLADRMQTLSTKPLEAIRPLHSEL